MLPKVAAITMAYNEATLLPIWTRHYARQVGADHCYVVDHGSTEPMVLPPGVNTIRLPRSAHNDERRATFISGLAGSLMLYYDWIIYTDVDELVVADPAQFRNLADFCASPGLPATVNAVGLDIQQVPSIEPALNAEVPVGSQRGWVRFTSAMCKPVLTRQPINWAPGFHCCEHPLAFDGLFLFHLHWADSALGLTRLQKTRQMPWGDDRFGAHQRVTDRAWLELFSGMAELPRRTDIAFAADQDPLRDWLVRTATSTQGRAGQTFTIDLGLNAAELWPIPPHFRACL